MTQQPVPDVQSLPTRSLLFDPENPRLKVDRPDDASQLELFAMLWQDFAVDELVSSIAANGFFQYEPIFAYADGPNYVVIEGNRRLAAVKALTGEFGVPAKVQVLPKISEELKQQLEYLPVRVTSRSDIWQYVGFKHVNGPQAWQSASKAEYVAWVHNDINVPLSQISEQIGDKHATVQRLYRALMVINEAAEADVWRKEDRVKTHFSFSHMTTGLDYGNIATFIEVAPAGEESRWPVPDHRLSELGELCIWFWGSRSLGREPIVQRQNPDLRRLNNAIGNPDALAALRKNLPIEVSEDIARGDNEILRESLVTAKSSLQIARGRVLTGYHAETDLLRLAVECSDLSYQLHREMEDMYERQREQRTSRTRPRGE
jgi:ParB-like nuclease domain